MAVAVIVDSTAEVAVLAVSKLAENNKIAVAKRRLQHGHSTCNCGVKDAVTTLSETVARMNTAAMTANTVTIAAETSTSRLKIAVAGQCDCGYNCCSHNH